MRRLGPIIILLFGMLMLLPAAVVAGPEPADEDEPYLPGLEAIYRDEQGHTATRLDHQLAFHWNQTPPDPRLTPGEFRATWRGHLLALSAGEYRFFVFGSGEIELKITGRVVIARQTVQKGWLSSAKVELASDHHPLELSFRQTDKDARLMLLWSGPDFGQEPIPARFLFHPREKPIASDFERGRLLARALRCGRCHGEEIASLPAPALDRLSGNLSRRWLIQWLMAGEHAAEKRDERSPRRMPAFGLSQAQAEAIADWLLKSRQSEPRASARGKEKSLPSGERLFVTLGCLACHTWGNLGASGWLGGGDLTHIADKRPANFFADWLADPSQLNRDHRMPIYQLSSSERTALARFLAEQKSSKEPADVGQQKSDHTAEGRKLIEQFSCIACHRLPEGIANTANHAVPRLTAKSDWNSGCVHASDPAKHRPGYRLNATDTRALRRYYADVRTEGRDGLLSLVEHNCLACHAREGTREAISLLPPLLADKLTAVAKRYPDLAPRIAELTPPALNSVGDKLTDAALRESIARQGEPHRPYLRVRMPRFPLPDDELQALVRSVIDTDRVPSHTTNPIALANPVQRERYRLAGGRLVSSDGFGCTSCHVVGHVQPSNDSISARGPDLSGMERRIRRPWYDRWVRNPARIVPRMEMPSVQIPVSGVLDGKLDAQLDAVWTVLNLPGFEPPLPNPIRTLRHTGNNATAEAIVLTDILQHGKERRIKPFLVGLANRHNVLFDLETGALAQWSIGDVARQHTRGKEWFWEPAGTAILDTALREPDLSMLVAGRDYVAHPLGQFITEADAWQTEGDHLELHYRLQFLLPAREDDRPKAALVCVRRKFTPLASGAGAATTGFTQELSISGVPSGARVRLHLFSPDIAAKTSCSADGRMIRLGDRFGSRIVLVEPAAAKFTEHGRDLLLSASAEGTMRATLRYESEIPVDRYPEALQPPERTRKGQPIEVGPGFTGQRLPLPFDIMPTGLCWRPDGRLIFCSLKGQVFEAVDTNHDGTEDHVTILADGVPAPYGVHAGDGYVDVSAKYALLRLRQEREGVRRIESIASGWGYSSDYHDWAVGLPQNERGEYFLGIPCQQDQRSPVAARFHGNVLRLTPRKPTRDDPRLFALTPVSSGHRFPMGLALDRYGELFVTDNQGNYKPFNELNHVRPGAHFGFINFLDRGKPLPPRTPPAIDIPHPWTRSVNGICFLYTPKDLRAKLGRDAFGPFEGQLIGCEYDTRRLIRMSLQRVGDTFQGAAYPLSIPPSDPERGLLGPLVCAVSPRGELYIGSIRDSGWGAGNNVGEIVRIQIDPDKLSCGITELRATHNGFTLDFTRPIDRTLASRADSYTIQSYRREPTPAYGGPDLDRRTEKVTAVSVSDDRHRVTLKLAEMLAGFVYEMRLKNLAPDRGSFHPAEVHYTLRVVPK